MGGIHIVATGEYLSSAQITPQIAGTQKLPQH